jgi:shikimate kinase
MSGKTSLAKALSLFLNYRVIYVDLVKSKTLLDVLTRIYHALPQDVISKIKENFNFLKLSPLKLRENHS